MGSERIGIIGGTGLGESLGAFGRGKLNDVDTPFGKPSAPIVTMEVEGVPVALLARHGEGHRFNPSFVPYRANIYALEKIAPKNLVIADQVIDKTFRRASTFFEEFAVHIDFAAPFCPTLRKLLQEAGRASPARVHDRGTYVCMEGPQLSTRAESELHRAWGADLIGMTVMPEAKLAREAEICYALVALPTDYDCWKPSPGDLDKVQVIEEILRNLKEATQNATDLIRRTLPAAGALDDAPCSCRSALSLGIWSSRKQIPDDVRQRLRLLLGKYLDVPASRD